ncbi:uncharacterized protein IUM83_17663 [Phytophthora cinnamomi]|uniref:uncharacterized protein n=1 Tax=Phytophthora cinnamomi TaxID=4785 RepID=UPI003559A2B0|nr:hypothetical protein IUM83_17663 [Phytophthora cinnamomi]
MHNQPIRRNCTTPPQDPLTLSCVILQQFPNRMSFLVTQDDNSILSEAFAFIDEACGGHGSSSGVDSTDGDSGLDGIPSLHDLVDSDNLELLEAGDMITENAKSSTVQDKICKERKQKTTKKRRVRNAETSSTGLQRRKRAELASLREQAEELESVLAQMKHGVVAGPSSHTDTRTAVVAMDSGRSEWYRHAIEQYRLRLQSEKTNRHLTSILKNQVKLRETLCGVLQKRSALYGMDYLMKSEVSRIFRLNQDSPSLSTSMECKYDERRQAKVIEFESTTPLACSLKDANSFVWREFAADRTPGTKPNTLLKKTVVTMSSRNGPIQAEKLNFVRKYEERDQTLVCWADIMVLPTKSELHFRTEGIVLLTPSTADPKQTLSRSYLKLYLDSNDAIVPLRPEDIAYAQDIVLGAMAMKIRMFWQSFQNMQIEESGRVTT